MKRIFTTLVLAVTLIAAKAGIPADRIEMGSFISKSGVKVIAAYVIKNNAYQEVHLFWPDGHETGIETDPRITTEKLDKSLQQFVDKQ